MGKFNVLPQDIILDIMTRLPTETVLECKLVCKPWRNLVGHPSFSQMYLTQLNHDGKLTFLSEDNGHFNFLEYNENHQEHRIERVNINPPFERLSCSIIGSSNGLICLAVRTDVGLSDYQPAYICNPLTREYVVLPKIINRNEKFKHHQIYHGFGYLRESSEYKVVRVHRLLGIPNSECVEVYTLGSCNGWRNVGGSGLSCSLYHCDIRGGVFLSESLYWITLKGKMVTFNLADERFCEISTVMPFLHHGGVFRVVVLDGALWYFNSYTKDVGIQKTVMWLLKKNGNQYMMEQKECLSLTWSNGSFYMKPLALMKSGEVLFYGSTKLCSYDIKSYCSKTLVKFAQNYLYQTVPHMNTLVSLKALGEENTYFLKSTSYEYVPSVTESMRKRRCKDRNKVKCNIL